MPRVAFSLAAISLIFPEAPANDPFGGRFWHREYDDVAFGYVGRNLEVATANAQDAKLVVGIRLCGWNPWGQCAKST
jgi:hypothetical protein